MPWGLNAGELSKIRTAHPGIAQVRELRPPRGTGRYYGRVAPILGRLPGVRNLRSTMTVEVCFSGAA